MSLLVLWYFVIHVLHYAWLLNSTTFSSAYPEKKRNTIRTYETYEMLTFLLDLIIVHQLFKILIQEICFELWNFQTFNFKSSSHCKLHTSWPDYWVGDLWPPIMLCASCIEWPWSTMVDHGQPWSWCWPWLTVLGNRVTMVNHAFTNHGHMLTMVDFAQWELTMVNHAFCNHGQ